MSEQVLVNVRGGGGTKGAGGQRVVGGASGAHGAEGGGSGAGAAEISVLKGPSTSGKASRVVAGARAGSGGQVGGGGAVGAVGGPSAEKLLKRALGADTARGRREDRADPVEGSVKKQRVKRHQELESTGRRGKGSGLTAAGSGVGSGGRSRAGGLVVDEEGSEVDEESSSDTSGSDSQELEADGVMEGEFPVLRRVGVSPSGRREEVGEGVDAAPWTQFKVSEALWKAFPVDSGYYCKACLAWFQPNDIHARCDNEVNRGGPPDPSHIGVDCKSRREYKEGCRREQRARCSKGVALTLADLPSQRCEVPGCGRLVLCTELRDHYQVHTEQWMVGVAVDGGAFLGAGGVAEESRRGVAVAAGAGKAGGGMVLHGGAHPAVGGERQAVVGPPRSRLEDALAEVGVRRAGGPLEMAQGHGGVAEELEHLLSSGGADELYTFGSHLPVGTMFKDKRSSKVWFRLPGSGQGVHVGMLKDNGSVTYFKGDVLALAVVPERDLSLAWLRFALNPEVMRVGRVQAWMRQAAFEVLAEGGTDTPSGKMVETVVRAVALALLPPFDDYLGEGEVEFSTLTALVTRYHAFLVRYHRVGDPLRQEVGTMAAELRRMLALERDRRVFDARRFLKWWRAIRSGVNERARACVQELIMEQRATPHDSVADIAGVLDRVFTSGFNRATLGIEAHWLSFLATATAEGDSKVGTVSEAGGSGSWPRRAQGVPVAGVRPVPAVRFSAADREVPVKAEVARQAMGRGAPQVAVGGRECVLHHTAAGCPRSAALCRYVHTGSSGSGWSKAKFGTPPRVRGEVGVELAPK